MTGVAIESTTSTFRFEFPTCTNEQVMFKLSVPVEIPHAGSTRELVQRLIHMFHIPVYLEDELNEQLSEFVSSETMKFHNERDEKLLNQLKGSEINVEGIVKNWEKLFKENVVEFAEQKGTSDEEVFAAAYHKLVHSPALETILQVEDSYAKTVMNTLKSRDEDIKKITQRQTEEMDEKLRQLNVTCSEEEINALAARHFSEQALAAGRWGSTLDALRHSQRAAHRAWLMATLQAYHTAGAALATPSNSPLATFSPAPAVREAPQSHPRLEESFTIHLGSQLKQTHNIRIVAMDLRQPILDTTDNGAEWSQRLQTALGLYSSELAGVVLLAEGGAALLAEGGALLPAEGGALLPAATASTDHHFPHIDAQLQNIAHKFEQLSGGEAARSGDVLVTSHSNLPDAHVVFHLVVDHSALTSGEMSSRHGAILGLRHVLKAASSHDITTISLPLLLRHDLSEEMTVSWCVRRAELVLKCVKGFMLEAAGGGGAQLRTLQLAAPPSTPPALFAALAALLPALFRLSTPLKVRPQPAH